MLSDNDSQLNQQHGFFPDRSPNSAISYFDKAYYATFLQEVGLKELIDENKYLLASQDGNNWSVSLEDIAKAMQHMQNQGNITSFETLSILIFIDRKSVV